MTRSVGLAARPELAASALNALGHAVEGPCTPLGNPVATLARARAARACSRRSPARRARPRRARARRSAGRLHDRLHRLRPPSRALADARAVAGAGHGRRNAVLLRHTIGALAWRSPAERMRALATALGATPPTSLRGCASSPARRGCATSAWSRGVLADCAEAAAERPELDLTPPRADRGRADGTLRGGMVSDDGLRAAKEKMQAEGVPDVAIATFEHYYEQLVAGESGMLPDDELEPLEDIPEADDLPDEADDGRARPHRRHQAQRRARHEHGDGEGEVAARRQGGPHLPRHHRPQILELRSKHGARLPLVLMDSFATSEDTLAALEQHPDIASDLPADFLQNKEPKIRVDDLHPVEWPPDPALEWCPPGHGDIYTALLTSGHARADARRGLRVRVPVELGQPRRRARPADPGVVRRRGDPVPDGGDAQDGGRPQGRPPGAAAASRGS